MNKGKKWVSDIGDPIRRPHFFSAAHFSVRPNEWMWVSADFQLYFPIPKSAAHFMIIEIVDDGLKEISIEDLN